MNYYYYFYELYEIDVIKQAFKIVCVDKMLSDGYFDMSIYIFGRINKNEMHTELVNAKSVFARLFDSKTSYPKGENSAEIWYKLIGRTHIESYSDELPNLTQLEAKAIVYWVYKTMSNSDERIDFTKELFSHIKDLYMIANDICYFNGVFYNQSTIELHIFDSLSDVEKFLAEINSANDPLFYRGHSDSNYYLSPSVMRSPSLLKNESKMYHELLINCPESFEKCNSHLEKLVEMQHYGLPTLLLDITRNPLVALYFACNGNSKTHGELIILSTKESEIKYPQSDAASILSSLPIFPYESQKTFYDAAISSCSKDKFNQIADRLVSEVRLEKPAFMPNMDKTDITSNFIVYALKNNIRIVRQDGAFILCGLSDHPRPINEFRYREHGKMIVVLVSNKDKILTQLDKISINYATLFPEIDHVSEYIKSKYSK